MFNLKNRSEYKGDSFDTHVLSETTKTCFLFVYLVGNSYEE